MKKNNVFAVIVDTNNAFNVPHVGGFFRPSYAGTTQYTDGKQTMLLTFIGGALEEQHFLFAFQNKKGLELAGECIINGITGLTRILTEGQVFNLTDFSSLGILWEARTFLHRAACMMGKMCYESFCRKAHTASRVTYAAAYTEMVVAEDATAFKTAKVDITDAGVLDDEELPNADAAEPIVETDGSLFTTMNVQTLSWPRRGCWVTKKDGSQFWRRGGIVNRHI